MIVALVLVAGAFMILVDLIVPAYEAAQKIKSDAMSRKDFVDRQSATIKQVQKLISTYAGQGQVQEEVSLRLPQSQDLAGALAQLNGLIQASRLAPQAFSISVTEAQNAPDTSQKAKKAPQDVLRKPIGTLTLQVKFIGLYDDLKSFLNRLETNIRIFDVRSLSIQPITKSNQDLYSFDMSILTYYQGS